LELAARRVNNLKQNKDLFADIRLAESRFESVK
jgi:hypothetical protein